MLLSDTGRNIDFAIEGAACKVISTEDGTLQKFVSASRVRDQIGVCTLSQIVHVGLVNIARLIGIATIGTTKDTADLDSRADRHIHHRTTGDTLFITATIGCTYLSTHQVDNSGGFVERSLVGSGIFRISLRRHHRAHSQTVIGTCTEHLGIGEFLHIVGNVYQHVAVILQLVTVTITRVSLSSTEDFLYGIVRIRVGSEVNEGVTQIRFLDNTIHIGRISVLIITEATTEDVSHPTLVVLHIRRNRMSFCHHFLDFVTDTILKI